MKSYSVYFLLFSMIVLVGVAMSARIRPRFFLRDFDFNRAKQGELRKRGPQV